jgi:hypothetical protein
LKVYFEDIIQELTKTHLTPYQIAFTSRHTYWEFNIINKSHQNIHELSVVGDAEVKFDSGKKVMLENNVEAIRFRSKNTNIPYSEVPKFQFNLINTVEKMGHRKPKILFKGLPMPNPSRLQIITKRQQKQVVSPTYVYIMITTILIINTMLYEFINN